MEVTPEFDDIGKVEARPEVAVAARDQLEVPFTERDPKYKS